MIHEEFLEMIILATINELDDFNAHKLKEHMSVCPHCGEEYKRMMDFNENVIRNKPVQEELLLEKARRELRVKLYSLTQKSSIKEKLISFLYPYKFALSGAVLFLIGVLSGLFFTTMRQQSNSVYDLLNQSKVRISNINFIDSDPADGEVAFEFDAVKPVSIRGKVSDSKILQILVHSLLNEKNDGTRLRAINAISSQTEITAHPGKIKSALIKTVKYDPNPGVRREALLTLNQLPVDREIIDVLLYVLEKDTNAGNRIAAINSFNSDKLKPEVITKKALEILKQKTIDDNNQYIKLRAKTVVEEVIKNESL